MSLEKLSSNLKKLEDLKKEGYKYVCMGCNTVYKEKPERWYEDGHGGRYIDMCRCDCDLFGTVDGIMNIIKEQISKLKA
jgi:hypothetical protein